jgi:bicarbonate transport system substrate-binding protein
MDGFSTGDPWPARIVADDIGFMAALTSEIWPFHPEEYLAIRKDWVDAHPKATKALLKGIIKAQQWLDQSENRAEAATILAKPAYFNLKESIIAGPLKGDYKMGDKKPDITGKNQGVLYWKDPLGSVSYPYKSHDLWFLTESVRWGFLPPETLDKASAMIDAVNREDIWKEAAKEFGVPAADIPTKTDRGIEKFFDGKTFDPANPKAYLDSLAIKKM